ncbi:hypothetical protein HK102_004921 [Quaeritorhiza haematococci]|nr:hypothetical protein HK102_004921 [Quaeritorhiza haematococci]
MAEDATVRKRELTPGVIAGFIILSIYYFIVLGFTLKYRYLPGVRHRGVVLTVLYSVTLYLISMQFLAVIGIDFCVLTVVVLSSCFTMLQCVVTAKSLLLLGTYLRTNRKKVVQTGFRDRIKTLLQKFEASENKRKEGLGLLNGDRNVSKEGFSKDISKDLGDIDSETDSKSTAAGLSSSATPLRKDKSNLETGSSRQSLKTLETSSMDMQPVMPQQSFVERLTEGKMVTVSVVVTLIFTGLASGLYGAYGCSFVTTYPNIGLQTFTALILWPALLIKNRNINDAYGFRKELLASTILNIVTYALQGAANALIGTKFFILLSDISYGIIFFINAVVNFIICVVPVIEALRVVKASAQKGATIENFLQTLRDPRTLQEFKEYTMQDWTVENVLFYEDMRDLRQRYPQFLKVRVETSLLKSTNSASQSFFTRTFEEDPTATSTAMRSPVPDSPMPAKERQKLALLRNELKAIYMTYIQEGAELEVNINDGIRRRIATVVAAASDAPLTDTSMFDEAQKEVLKMMYENSFPRFIRSRATLLIKA